MSSTNDGGWRKYPDIPPPHPPPTKPLPESPRLDDAEVFLRGESSMYEPKEFLVLGNGPVSDLMV
jgi:hypothetical protein